MVQRAYGIGAGATAGRGEKPPSNAGRVLERFAHEVVNDLSKRKLLGAVIGELHDDDARTRMDVDSLPARTIGEKVSLLVPVLHRDPPVVLVLHLPPGCDLRLGPGPVERGARLNPVTWQHLDTVGGATVEKQASEAREIACGRIEARSRVGMPLPAIEIPARIRLGTHRAPDSGLELLRDRAASGPNQQPPEDLCVAVLVRPPQARGILPMLVHDLVLEVRRVEEARVVRSQVVP